MLAAKDYHMDKIAIAGGVASNGALREAMTRACERRGYKFYRPSPIFCTDNAAMIGVAAYYEYIKGTRHGWDLNAVPNLKLGEQNNGAGQMWTAIVLAAGQGKTNAQQNTETVSGNRRETHSVLFYGVFSEEPADPGYNSGDGRRYDFLLPE